jgi:hypothetical protein
LEGRYLLFHHSLAEKPLKFGTSRASTLYGGGAADANDLGPPAYRLRIDASQRQTLLAQLRAVAPSAQLYDLMRLGSDARTVVGVPGYTDFTDSLTADFNFTGDRARLVGAVALLATLLVSILIVVIRETWALIPARHLAGMSALENAAPTSAQSSRSSKTG